MVAIAVFILGFGLLVFIHEWGHYRVARLFDVKIESFSVGMGPELAGRYDQRGVRWKLCALPIGGYVQFAGDANAASLPSRAMDDLPPAEQSRLFQGKPLYQRALIVLAGPAINIAVGLLVFAAFYMSEGVQIAPPVIGTVIEDSAAAQAGLLSGDRILSVDDKNVSRFAEIGDLVRLYPGAMVRVAVERQTGAMERQTERLVIPVTLDTRYLEDRFGNRYALGVLGIQSATAERIFPGPFQAVGEGIRTTASTIDSIFTTIGQMVMGVRSVKEAGGPVRIGSMMGEAANQGVGDLIILLALISINLGVINLLPIPILDGGHLLFYAIEAVKGSPLNEKAQTIGLYLGAVLMLSLMVLVTVNDLHSLFL